MLYNNDDFNELFQKAAKDYPLRTDNSDWDDIAAKLKDSEGRRFVVKKKNLTYATVFLLLVFSSAVIFKTNFKTGNTAASVQPKQEISNAPIKQLKPAGSNNNDILSAAIASNHDDQSFIENASIIKTSNSAVMNDNIGNIRTTLNAGLDVIAINGKSFRLGNLENLSATETSVNSDALAGLDDNKTTGKNFNSREIRVNPSYKIYGTFYGGPEFSIVKFQRGSNAGFRIGVGLGYRISNTFSAELRLQREHINFYSNGRYIDTSLLKIKPGTDIENVSAKSKITSVPLLVRYNFPSKGHGKFSVAAGVNAVIITHNEQYKYSVSKDGEELNLSKNYSSLKSPKYFSGVNAAIAYETRLSGWCNIKVEPYYQTPVNNFGVGRLPVSNFGVDIAIVKDLR